MEEVSQRGAVPNELSAQGEQFGTHIAAVHFNRTHNEISACAAGVCKNKVSGLVRKNVAPLHLYIRELALSVPLSVKPGLSQPPKGLRPRHGKLLLGPPRVQPRQKLLTAANGNQGTDACGWRPAAATFHSGAMRP